MHSKQKACEFCGTISDNYFYRFLAESQYLLFLNNSAISSNNTEERYVTLTDGRRIEYSLQIDDSRAVNFDNLIPHIFCSEQCEDRFINKYAPILRDDIHLSRMMLDFREMDVFSPMSFPTESIQHQVASCKACGEKFPNFSKSYEVRNIVNERAVERNFTAEQIISNEVELFPHEIMVSDISGENTHGKSYIYKTGLELENFQFCSNECCVKYCGTHSSIAFFKSNIEKGQILCLSKEVPEINRALKNAYRYQPLEFSRYSS